jgi:hypothetical protein
MLSELHKTLGFTRGFKIWFKSVQHILLKGIRYIEIAGLKESKQIERQQLEHDKGREKTVKVIFRDQFEGWL